MDIKERYEELYVEHIINGDGRSTPEMSELFNKILNDEFNDDHNKMDALIQSIIDEHTPHVPTETEILQNQVAQLAFKLMQLESEV